MKPSLAIVFLIATWPVSVVACSCASFPYEEPDIRQAFGVWAIMFVGTVKHIEMHSEDPQKSVTVNVDEPLQGDINEDQSIEVLFVENENCNGPKPDLNRPYFVFGNALSDLRWLSCNVYPLPKEGDGYSEQQLKGIDNWIDLFRKYRTKQ